LGRIFICFHFLPPPSLVANPVLHLRAKLLLTRQPRRPNSVLVLWSKPTKPRVQTPVVSHYPAPAPCSRLCLAFLVTVRSALEPVGHQAPRTKLACLSTPWRPHRHRPFTLVLHLHYTNQATTCNYNTGKESVHTMLSFTRR
jgi:hypothetical protein